MYWLQWLNFSFLPPSCGEKESVGLRESRAHRADQEPRPSEYWLALITKPLRTAAVDWVLGGSEHGNSNITLVSLSHI